MIRPAFVAACALALVGAAEPAPSQPPAVDLGRIRAQGDALVAPAGRALAELTLDPTLEREAERLLDEARPVAGAVVAVDLRTGRILAWAERKKDGRGPSVITTPHAPAASVFKLVTTAALYEKTDVTPS